MTAEKVSVTGNLDTDTHWYGRTPYGTLYSMKVRPGTSDWNTVHACAGSNDEYRLPKGLSGWALDIGAHIGAAAIPLLLDSPELRVIAVEALPENVLLLHENADRNGVSSRLTIIHAAASCDTEPVTIHYAPDDPQHEFIGNAGGPPDRPGISIRGIDLAGILRKMPDPDGDVVWTKIDCEGCEYQLFTAAPERMRQLRFITGEVHQGWSRLVELLSPTHQVVGPGKDFGPFTAKVR